VKNKRERPEWPPGDGETIKLGSRDPVDSRIKCGSNGVRRARLNHVHGGAGAEQCLSSGLIG
jgi:hypothetical protein